MDERLEFGFALERLKSGQWAGMTRKNWYDSAANPVVKLQRPDEHSKMKKPYLYMEKNEGESRTCFPLDLSCESIMSNDWVKVG